MIKPGVQPVEPLVYPRCLRDQFTTGRQFADLDRDGDRALFQGRDSDIVLVDLVALFFDFAECILPIATRPPDESDEHHKPSR